MRGARGRASWFALCGLLIAAGCSDSGAGDAPGGAQASDSGKGGHGGAGTAADGSGGTGGGASGSGGAGDVCKEREAEAGNAVQRAVDAADLSCGGASDCEIVDDSSRCHFACGALVSARSRYAVQDAIDTTNEVLCRAFEAAGCKALAPPCDPPDPRGFGCIAGRCRWRDAARADAGDASDAGAELP
jgi:hypothetical protein